MALISVGIAAQGFFFPGGITAGNFRNYIHFDPRLLVDNNTEMRLVRYLCGRANREVEETPGVTRNLDHNVLVELVRVTVNPSTGGTNYGTMPTVFLNGGALPATGFNLTTPDSTAQWRHAFQIRRGVRKRWDWGSALRLGIDPVSGWREILTVRFAFYSFTTLSTLFSYQLDFATSPEDVPN